MTIKLPHTLGPWEAQLRIFPEEMAMALSPLVQKVAALLGPFLHHQVEGHVVPDGFAGLAKRGTYERLIASDWLLADELPDEFMRRSVMGEHLFWKLAYREPAQTRSTLVLFDAGPEQLGAPRLLHLAALAVFDARARAAKANFNWGILQSTEHNLWPGMNCGEVEMLLNARGALSAQPEYFDGWLQRAAEAGHTGEIWLVGSERLRRLLPASFSSLLVTDLVNPGERKLRVECRPSGKHTRQIELELPEPGACARLLRDPFSIAVAAPKALGTGSGIRSLVFNPTGNKLWVRTEQGRIITIPVPNSPREKVGKPKEFETLGSFPVAIGRSAKTTVLVSIEPATRTLSLARFGRRRSGYREGAYSFVDPGISPVFQSDRLSLCAWHSIAGRKEGFYLVDDAGALLRLFVDSDGQRCCDLVHPHVLALTLAQSGMCYAGYDSSGGGQVSVYLNDHNVPTHSWPSAAAPTRAFLGYAAPPSAPSVGLLALEYANSQWEICVGQSHTPVAVPQSFSVHGVVRDAAYEETLIAVDQELPTLVLHGAHGTRPLVRASVRITAVCGCPQRPLIACGTETGEVSVYSLKHGRTILDSSRSET
jgi:hypothetical protein